MRRAPIVDGVEGICDSILCDEQFLGGGTRIEDRWTIGSRLTTFSIGQVSSE